MPWPMTTTEGREQGDEGGEDAMDVVHQHGTSTNTNGSSSSSGNSSSKIRRRRRGLAGSVLRVLEPSTGKTRQLLELEPGLMAVAVEVLKFRCAPPNELFVVVAVVPMHSPSTSYPSSSSAAGSKMKSKRQRRDEAPTPIPGGGAVADKGGTATITSISGLPPPPVAGYLYTYRVLASGLVLAHKTEIAQDQDVGPPLSLCAFAEEGKLLVGFGPSRPTSPSSLPSSPCVRLYDLGKRRLLKKADSGPLGVRGGGGRREGGRVGGGVTRLLHEGPWVYAVDCVKGVQVLFYVPSENAFHLVADEYSTPRLISEALLLDRTTVAGADRQGNVFVSRVPWEAVVGVEGVGFEGGTEGGQEGPVSRKVFWEICGEEGEAPSKMETMVEFHVGEVVTSMTTTNLGRRGGGGRAALLYATISGALGVLSPLRSPREKELLLALETALVKGLGGGGGGKEGGGLDPVLFPTGRDPLTFRSAIRPSKGVIDLDLIACAGPTRRRKAAREAKLDVREVEEVVGEAFEAMNLSRG